MAFGECPDRPTDQTRIIYWMLENIKTKLAVYLRYYPIPFSTDRQTNRYFELQSSFAAKNYNKFLNKPFSNCG